MCVIVLRLGICYFLGSSTICARENVLAAGLFLLLLTVLSAGNTASLNAQWSDSSKACTTPRDTYEVTRFLRCGFSPLPWDRMIPTLPQGFLLPRFPLLQASLHVAC